MSQPPYPPTDGPTPFSPPADGPAGSSSSGFLSSEPASSAPYYPSSPAAEPDPGVQWTTPPAPSWTQPWAPPSPPVLPGQPVGGIGGPGHRRPGNRLVLVLVAVVAALFGAVIAGLVVTAAVVPSAQEIGEEVAAAAGPGLEDSISDGFTEGMNDAMEDYDSYWAGGEESYEPPPAEEQFPPTEPGELGPDPVLNSYADSCFAGDLRACDDLYYEAPPLSEYEQYAVTCGGRIKAYMAQYCTDLD